MEPSSKTRVSHNSFLTREACVAFALEANLPLYASNLHLVSNRFAFMSKMTDKQMKDNIYQLLASNTLECTAYPAQMLPIASSETLAAG